MKKHLSDQHPCAKGVITLLSVLVVGAIGLSTSLLLLLHATAATQTSGTLTDSLQARGLADACAEIALNKLRLSQSYTGNETLSISSGSCTIQTLTGSGSQRTIRTTGTLRSTIRKVEIITSSFTPSIQLSAWQEKDF